MELGTQGTDGVRSGHPDKGLDSGDATPSEGKSKGFSHSAADGILLAQESRSSGCPAAPMGEMECSPGKVLASTSEKAWRRPEPGSGWGATGQPDCRLWVCFLSDGLICTSGELVPDWGHTWGPLRMPHLGRHPNGLNIVAGGFRTAGGEEAWRPVHGSSWEAEIQRQSNTSDWGSDPRMRVQEPGHKSHTEAGRAVLWVTGRRGSQVEGRQAPTRMVICPGLPRMLLITAPRLSMYYCILLIGRHTSFVSNILVS